MRKLIPIISSVVIVAPAFSATTFYADRASFEAALGAATVLEEDFNSFGSDTLVSDFGGVFSGFTVTEEAGTVFDGDFLVDVPTFEFSPGLADIDGTARLNFGGLNADGLLTFAFDSPVSAFGFDTVNYDNVGDGSLDILVDGSIVGGFPPFDEQVSFFGLIVTDEPGVSSFQIGGDPSDDEAFNALDNVSFVSASDDMARIPEPSSFMGLGLLLGASIFLRKRR